MKVLSAGSVDDGKSTLLGRLVFDSGNVPEDTQNRLQGMARPIEEAPFDFALAFDGLLDERAQGITIDVAWCTLRLAQSTVVLADCPGHAQYTGNLVSAASQCDAAIVLVDATRGVSTQTRRHLLVCSIMGIERVFVAINKIDLLDEMHTCFTRICFDVNAVLSRMPRQFADVTFAPTSGLRGINVSQASAQTPWYAGPTLQDWLLSLSRQDVNPENSPWFSMPVQRHNRQSSTWRGFDGTILAGALEVGQTVQAQPSGQTSVVAALRCLDGSALKAVAGQAVSVMLAEELDLSRGEVLLSGPAPVVVSEIIEASLIWLSREPPSLGARHRISLACASTYAVISKVLTCTDIETLEEVPADAFSTHAVARVEVMLEKPLALTRYADSRDLGGFILVEMQTNETLAAGMVIDPAPRQIFWQNTVVAKADRAQRLKQTPKVIWFTGLSGSGKSTIANATESALHQLGYATYLLDGDNLRHGMCRDLGFSETDRAENLRRAGEVARLMVDAGLVVLASFIAPSARERAAVAARFELGEFLEVYVSTPLAECEARDPKGLYKLARAGKLPEFTGVSSPYDEPTAPALALNTSQLSVEECVRRVLALVSATP